MLFSVHAGLLEACVLEILRKEYSYGYKLTQDVKSLIPISESTLYPVLRRLEKEGLLEPYEMPFEGRSRKYYKLTERGEERHQEHLREWDDYKKLIDRIFKGGFF